MRAAAGSLPSLEVPVGCGDRAFARRHDIASRRDAHRATGLPPFESGLDEDFVQSGRFGGGFDMGGAGHDQGLYARRDLASLGDSGSGFEVGQAAVGAGADERDVDRRAGDRRSRRQANIADRTLHHRSTGGIGNDGWVGNDLVHANDILRRGAPTHLRAEGRTIDFDFAVEHGIRQIIQLPPVGHRLVP